MIQILAHYFESHPCSYLEGRTARTEYLIMDSVSPAELDHLLERGWRRFGRTYFRPACKTCRACEPLRVQVERFEPTPSQRRVGRKCHALTVVVGSPQVDSSRLELYRQWHLQRESKKNWPQSYICEAEYAALFCEPHSCAIEMAYYRNDELVAIGIVDQTRTALSSVYFYFSPNISRLSPGTGSILRELQHARSQGLHKLYLGYWIRQSPSMAYKSCFKPHELLTGRPDFLEQPEWAAQL